MKAKTKKTRWLLLSLLFGLLAIAGLAFTLRHHRAATTFAKTLDDAGPSHAAVPQSRSALPAALGEQRPLKVPTGLDLEREIAQTLHSNTSVRAPRQLDSQANSSTVRVSSLHPASYPAGRLDEKEPRSPPAPSSNTGREAQDGTGTLASSGYAPLDCELPAGCGGIGFVSRPAEPTAGPPLGDQQEGGAALNHNTGQQTSSDSGSQAGLPGPSTPVGGETLDPKGQGLGSDPSVASAPELDPTTLAAAVTLLLGSLAVVVSRRVRVTR